MTTIADLAGTEALRAHVARRSCAGPATAASR